ncbi:reverse transcriptase domain-containing protein [Tanacetum coccineum]
MRCLKFPSKLVKSLTFGALDFMRRFPCLQEGTIILLVASLSCQNGLMQKCPTNDAPRVCKLLKSLLPDSVPRAIISDRGTYFFNDQFAKVMLKYGFTHRLSTTYHPQTSGQVEAKFQSKWLSFEALLEGDIPQLVSNEDNELIPTRLVTGWHVCIDYRKLNDAIQKDHFPLPFMDQMLERSAGNEYYCFLDGFSRCMMAIFHVMIEETMEVFMDDFSVFEDSFSSCLSHLDKMLKRCEDTNLVLNWEKYHFMVKEGIVLSHKILKSRIEVDRAKVDVIAKLPPPTSAKGIWSFLGHAGFYRRFIQDFFKIARPMTHLLEKETLFIFSTECREAFETLKKKLTEAPILVAPD